MLVIVEHRDVESFLERLFDLKGPGCCDVLQVDTTECRRKPHHGLDEIVGTVDVEADREGIDLAEFLEQQRLALHHGHRRLGADVTETEHRCAVGDDGHRVLSNRVGVGQRLVGLDGLADPSDTRRVGHRKVVLVADREQRQNLDLSALVHAERTVEAVEKFDPVDRSGNVDDLLLVLDTGAVDDDVPFENRPLGHEPLDGEDIAARFADGDGQPTEYTRLVVEPHTKIDRVLGTCGSTHGL